MNQKEWKKYLQEKTKNLFEFRNKAVKYFNLQKGEVIHHLRETKEQQEFNNIYYERWGFDLNDEMKFAIKMTVEEHNEYHKYDKTKADKISKALKGKYRGINNSNYGKKLSDETKQKIRDKNKGISRRGSGWTCNDDLRKKFSESAKKRPIISEDTRKKLSNYMKTAEHNIGKLTKGKKLSDKRKKEISKNLQGRFVSEETKLKIKNSNTGQKRSIETCKKISESKKGKIPWNKGLKYTIK